MVRRGSTVRVRQRASTNCLQIGISCRLSAQHAGTARVHLWCARRISDVSRRLPAHLPTATTAETRGKVPQMGIKRCLVRRFPDPSLQGGVGEPSDGACAPGRAWVSCPLLAKPPARVTTPPQAPSWVRRLLRSSSRACSARWRRRSARSTHSSISSCARAATRSSSSVHRRTTPAIVGPGLSQAPSSVGVRRCSSSWLTSLCSSRSQRGASAGATSCERQVPPRAHAPGGVHLPCDQDPVTDTSSRKSPPRASWSRTKPIPLT